MNKNTPVQPKCDGCARHCEFNAKLIKIYGTELYMPTINDTPTEQHSPFKSQAVFCTTESCIEHAKKVAQTRCVRHYNNKSR